MTTLSKEDVSRVAMLSGLTLNDIETEQYLHEFQEIIGYFDKLNNYDITGVEPTYQVNGLVNVTRHDEVIDYGVSQQELLKNAPSQQDGQIKVGKVL